MNRALFLGLVLTAGCSASPTTASRYLIYDRDDATGAYRLIASPIATLADARRGDGAIASLRGGGHISIGNTDPKTDEEVRGVITVDGADAPDIELTLDSEGVAVPWDYDGLLMLSLYHHLERASAFFADLGVDPARVRKLPVYYDAGFELPLLALPVPLFVDNAAYLPTLDAFLIPPGFALHDVPLVTNRGVIVHEYAHAVFNRLAGGDRRVAPYLVDEMWPAQAINELRSLDEGLADTFAALETGDPDFITPSLAGLDRDLAKDRIYDGALFAKVADDPAGYNPYALGSVAASALWDAAELAGRDVFARALIRAIDALPVDAGFSLVRVFDRLDGELPVETRAAACALFRARLLAVEASLRCMAQ